MGENVQECAEMSDLHRASTARRVPRKPVQSGNPLGRPRASIDISAMARRMGPKCLDVLDKLLDDADPRVRYSAAVALLDRGFGRPVQAVSGTTDMPTILQLMHHEAATAFRNQLLAEREAAERQLREPRVINGEATDTPNTNGSHRSICSSTRSNDGYGSTKERCAAGARCHALVRCSECHAELSGHLRRHAIAAAACASGGRSRHQQSVKAQPHAGRSIPHGSARGGCRGRAGCERAVAREHVTAGGDVIRSDAWLGTQLF
jgi:hypothetical protein